MTDIEQAARAAAERRHAAGELYDLNKSRLTTFTEGASWLAEYLLSDESVERLARALYRRRGLIPLDWESVPESVQDYWRREAGFALSAVLSTNNTDGSTT